MKTRITLFAGILALTSTTACTAIILSQVSGRDYGVDAGSDGTSSSSSGDPSSTNPDGSTGPCSLLTKSDESTVPDNACNDCISQNCGSEVTYACNGGQPQSWYTTLRNCAEQPYVGFTPPEAGVEDNSWGCQGYVTVQGAFTGDPNSDGAHQRNSEICVHDKCLQGSQPPCGLCPVSIAKDPNTNPGEVSYLSRDPCGQCLGKCSDEVVACCNTKPLADFVQYCAYSARPEYLTNCQMLGDAGASGTTETQSGFYDSTDKDCLTKLAACFQANCLSNTSCFPAQ